MTRGASRGFGVGGRGQLVLVAAGVVAVALVPVLVAYLQLGYAGDVAASDGYTAPTRDAERTLARAVDDASQGIPGAYPWSERREAVDAVRSRLAPALASLRTSRLRRGTVYRVRYNASLARRWARNRCPRGPNRQFGACRARNGVVVQNRSGQVHVVAVAVDLTVVGEQRRVKTTVVVGPVRGVR